MKVALPGSTRVIHQLLYGVDANNPATVSPQFASEPTLSAANIQNGVGLVLEDTIDDHPVGDEDAALDFRALDGLGPSGGIVAPRGEHLKIACVRAVCAH